MGGRDALASILTGQPLSRQRNALHKISSMVFLQQYALPPTLLGKRISAGDFYHSMACVLTGARWPFLKQNTIAEQSHLA